MENPYSMFLQLQCLSYFAVALGIYDDVEREYEGYDGWYNNKAHPDWGGAGKCLLSKFYFTLLYLR